MISLRGLNPRHLMAGLISVALSGLTASVQAFETYAIMPELQVRSIQLDGTVEAIRQSTVAAQTAGTVSEIFYDVGDQVAPGSVLLKISDTEQQARLEQAQAAVLSADVNLKDARQNFDRIEGIYQRKLASQAQYDQARNQLDSAKASHSKAQAALKEARKQVSYTRVIAPYGGVVTERHVELGEVVAPGSSLMSGIDLNQLRVYTSVPQRYAAGVRRHRQASVMMPDGHYLEAAHLTVFPYADAASHQFPLRIRLPEGQKGLYPGMLLKVKIPVTERPILAMPRQALVIRGDLRAVYLIDHQGKPRLRQIRIGQTLADNRVEVLSGLLEGDRIALEPARILAGLKPSGVAADD